MKLFTEQQYQQLIRNGSPENAGKDHFPVIKWFTPDANCTWLITELIDEDNAFGLCDLGLGFPELGYISFQEIRSVRGKWGLPVEHDICFDAEYPLSVYAEAARLREFITLDPECLKEVATRVKK